ncbi:MAG: D-glycero-beta-D-manno-heptose 1-phosphate adenylyltransferase [Sedimentisphaerales bacterium]|nr:D-glycero-beta-D-manno-heptose 1-phosphate adenylyltransferase [Sedimentisphaerales bacterium]
MYENLLKAVTKLGSPKVLLVGDFMLDVYVYGDAERISPEAPVPVLKVNRTEYSCGGAGLVAANLCALGAIPLCVGVIGSDINADKLRDLLKEKGADVTGLMVTLERPTTTKQRLVGLAQHRHQQQLFRMDYEEDEPLTEKQLARLAEIYDEKLGQADVVCLQDYNKGVLAGSFCSRAIRMAAKANKKVLIDPSPITHYSKYTGATLLTPNRQEAHLGVGFEINTIEDAANAAKELVKKLKLESIVITLDKEGAYLKSPDFDGHVPTRPRNIYDVTGAGDTVLGTLAIALATGCDYKTAVQLSNIAGGIEVEKFGGATVTIEEIISEIAYLNSGNLGKVLSLDLLLAELAWRRKKAQKIVFTNGCFDVIHRGHIEFLKFCKKQGDVVVVGINSDRSVKIIKGSGRPIHNQVDRAAVLAAMESVDYITIFDEPDPLNLIKKVRPDVQVKGQDWKKKDVIGADFVQSYGGRVVLAPLVKGKSSTKVIEKMKSLEARKKS